MSCTQIQAWMDKQQGKTTAHTPQQQKTPRTQEIYAAKRQEQAPATLVFLRSSVVASAVPAKLYELDNGRPRFLSEIRNNTQVHHRVSAGKHLFMLMSDNSVDYLPAVVEPDRTYYSIVKPSMGAWKPSFALLPVKHRPTAGKSSEENLYFDDEQVEALLSSMTPVVQPEGRARAVLDQEVLRAHKDAWARWADQDSGKRLDISDGRSARVLQ